MVPRLLFAPPSVADRPLAVFGGVGDALAPLPPPPHATTLDTASSSTAAPPKKAISLLRVMLAPLGWGTARGEWSPAGPRLSSPRGCVFGLPSSVYAERPAYPARRTQKSGQRGDDKPTRGEHHCVIEPRKG